MQFENFFAGDNPVVSDDESEVEANAIKIVTEQSLKYDDLVGEWDTAPTLAVMLNAPEAAVKLAVAETSEEIPDGKIARGIAMVIAPIGDITDERRPGDALREFSDFLSQNDFPFTVDEVVGVMFKSEAWVLSTDDDLDKDEVQKHGSEHTIHEHPKRHEVKMVAAELMSGWSVFGVLDRESRDVYVEKVNPGSEVKFDGDVRDGLLSILAAIRLRAASE